MEKAWFDACAKVFKVPKASLARRLVVSGHVESLADHARLEYRGHHPMTRDEAIHFSQICLRTSTEACETHKKAWSQGPMTCDEFFLKEPELCRDGLWARKSRPERITGHTRQVPLESCVHLAQAGMLT